MTEKQQMHLSNRDAKPSFAGYSRRACTPNPIPLGPQRYQANAAWKRTAPQPPQWSLGVKPEMVIGGAIPSCVKSIPGPKYKPDVDKYKQAAPSWTILGRGEYPGGSHALQGRLEKEHRAELRQAEKSEKEQARQWTEFADADFLRQSASPSMLNGLSTAQLLQLRESLATGKSQKLNAVASAPALNSIEPGSTNHLLISPVLASTGRSQVCSARSKSVRAINTGSSIFSSASQMQRISEAVHFEVEKQLRALRDAKQPISRQQLADSVLEEVGKKMQLQQVVAQPVGRRQRLTEMLQRANALS